MVRYNPTITSGLTHEEVTKRINEHLVNYDDIPKTKTIKEIIISNFWTYFNFLNLALGLAVFLASLFSGNLLNGLKNCLFMGVIFINSIISIVEEIISKKIIDKLSLLNESEIITIRDGKEVSLKLEELVLDDIIKLEMGHQIVADSIIMEGMVEVNESLLTGEADSILKKEGDMLLSGSFIVSGNCYAKVEHVGESNYTSTISKEAKYEKKINSVIMDSFEKLLKIISIVIIPVAVIMYFTQLASWGSIYEAIYRTVAALIGMIPEGLVLLTSSVMAVSVIRLSKYKVLVQQLYCIETLARVDCLCIDKTGTLTEGKMKVLNYYGYQDFNRVTLKNILCAYMKNSKDNNSTMLALKEYFNEENDEIIIDSLPFSSERKFSAISLASFGSIYIGAKEALANNDKDLDNYLKDYVGNRILVVGQSNQKLSKIPKNIQIIGIIIIEDVLRQNAKETLDYFNDQKVMVKIISGDSVSTVLDISQKLKLENIKGIDVFKMSDDELKKNIFKYNVFGRVSPQQKKLIVKTLQNDNHVVAMMGDGVNDVLALKQSDCAISLANGADASKNVSQLILLNNDFSSLPHVVGEGRRTINNIERSGSLLLAKTFYTMFLILFSVLASAKYYFIPIQLTLITTCTIGIPSFILALEPNNELVKGNFLLKMITKSLPVALTVLVNVILVNCFAYLFDLSYDLLSTLCVYLTALTGFIYLYKICSPFTILRVVLFAGLIIIFIYAVTYCYPFFNLVRISNTSVLIAFVLCIDSLWIYHKLNHLISKIFNRLDKTIIVE